MSPRREKSDQRISKKFIGLLYEVIYRRFDLREFIDIIMISFGEKYSLYTSIPYF